MAEDEKYVFYKTTVKFTLGIRFTNQDRQGIILNPQNPYVAVKKSGLREFLQANKAMVHKGYIVPTEEPIFEEVSTTNAFTDEEAIELVKSFFILKKKLPTIDSEGALVRLRDIAIEQGRSQKIVTMIDDRLAEITPTLMMGEN